MVQVRRTKDRPTKLNTRFHHMSFMATEVDSPTLVELVSLYGPWYTGYGEKVQALYCPNELKLFFPKNVDGSVDYYVIPANHYVTVSNGIAEPIPDGTFVQNFRPYKPKSKKDVKSV